MRWRRIIWGRRLRLPYLAATFCSFGFLLVGWGHEAALPAAVVHDHQLAGVTLGTSLVWRLVSSVVVYAVLTLICEALGYTREMHWALGLTALLFALNQFGAGYKDTIRGLERTDVPAYAHVMQQFLAAIFVSVAFLSGGQLRTALTAQSLGGGRYSSRSGRPFAASEWVACGCNGRSSSSCLSVARRSCC